VLLTGTCHQRERTRRLSQRRPLMLSSPLRPRHWGISRTFYNNKNGHNRLQQSRINFDAQLTTWAGTRTMARACGRCRGAGNRPHDPAPCTRNSTNQQMCPWTKHHGTHLRPRGQTDRNTAFSKVTMTFCIQRSSSVQQGHDDGDDDAEHADENERLERARGRLDVSSFVAALTVMMATCLQTITPDAWKQ
jgi:hypothetical protein